MDAARWNRIEELLQAALDRPPDKRAAFLRGACGSDAALRREIEELLAHESHASSFLSRSPSASLFGAREALTGRTISHYRVQAKIGAGGMGEVYEAHDENLRRTVALKVLPEEFTSDPERVRRFEQEAFAASRLNHPNIVTIHAILHTDGAHFIAEELIDGKTVRDLLEESGRLPIENALDVTIQAAEALKAAHTAWIIHRDIKPENIMVRADGLVKVLDFGIAKRNDEPSAPVDSAQVLRPVPTDLTAAGAILGTAKYMSPEQARGEPLDARTDLFSLGLVFQEMLTGEREGKLDAAPKELQRIVRKMLRTNRDERYSNAGELLDELRRAKRHRESRTARRMVGIGVLAVVLAIAVASIAAVLSIQESWEERVLRDGHTAAVRQAVFSPDGTKVVSCGEDGQVIVWDFARRERVATLADGVSAHKVAWSPDGKWIAAGHVDGRVTVWDARRLAKTRDFKADPAEIGLIAFTPDSTGLVVGGNASYRYDTTRWQKVDQWEGGGNHGSFSFTRAGRYVIVASGLRIHDFVRRTTTPSDMGGSNWAVISPDGSRMASIEGLGDVRFHRFHERPEGLQFEVTHHLPGHQDHGRAVDWSPDGALVATAAEDILLWDAETARIVARLEYPAIVWSIEFSPDGRSLLSAHGDGAVLIWDVETRRCVANLNGHSGAVRAVAFSPDGRRVASGSEDRSIVIWDAGRGRKEAVLQRHETRVTAVSFSPDGRLVTVDQNGTLFVWDLAGKTPRRSYVPPRKDPNYTVRISPDGRFIAMTNSVLRTDGRVLTPWATLPQLGQIYGNDYEPGGTWLATAATGIGTLAIWDAASYRLLERRDLGAGIRLITVSVSRDAKHIVTGEDQGAVRLWATNPLREIAILGRHAARVKSVAFSPEGRTAASAGDDGMIALWDVERRKLLARIGTHASPVYAIAFSPDGKRLVSGEHDRSVRIYTRRRTLWGFRLE